MSGPWPARTAPHQYPGSRSPPPGTPHHTWVMLRVPRRLHVRSPQCHLFTFKLRLCRPQLGGQQVMNVAAQIQRCHGVRMFSASSQVAPMVRTMCSFSHCNRYQYVVSEKTVAKRLAASDRRRPVCTYALMRLATHGVSTDWLVMHSSTYLSFWRSCDDGHSLTKLYAAQLERPTRRDHAPAEVQRPAEVRRPTQPPAQDAVPGWETVDASASLPAETPTLGAGVDPATDGGVDPRSSVHDYDG